MSHLEPPIVPLAECGTTSSLASVADVSLVSLPQGGDGPRELVLLLDALDALLLEYVAFPSQEARWATAAWVVHTWALDAFESTPRLALLSAEKGSGKTRTLEVLEQVVPGPLHTVNVSAAALFRKVADGRCTLLLDEADTYLGLKVAQQHEDLRGLVNAGHRRGAVAYRCVVEKGVTVQEFPAFAPVAIAGIGDMPDTIIDRAIVVSMKRRAPNEQVRALRHRHIVNQTQSLRDRLEEWGKNYSDDLAELEPEMPNGIVDRPADVWEPLIMLGDFSSSHWGSRLRDAAIYLNGERQQRDPSLGVQLLADCRRVFEEVDVDRFMTEHLLAALVVLEESPWGDLRGQELDARGLSRRLRPFDVKPGQHRFGETTKKGYLRADFHDAWLRYLSPLGEGKQAKQEEQDGGIDEDLYADMLEEAAEEYVDLPVGQLEHCGQCGSVATMASHAGPRCRACRGAA